MDWKYALFSFSGRLNRARWWMATIVLAVVFWVIGFLDMSVIHGPTIATFNDGNGNFVGLGLLSVIAWVVATICSIALGVKRLHDRDRSGWFYLLLFVPLINIWPVIEILFLRGTPGPNRFGPDPLGGAAYPMAA